MNDRELLELAAKAAGLQIINFSEGYGLGIEGGGVWWNPLENDGHAFWLAVKLHMTLVMLTGECEVLFDNNGRESSVVQDDGEEGELSDPELTRRAIVRAAAEIGRATP